MTSAQVLSLCMCFSGLDNRKQMLQISQFLRGISIPQGKEICREGSEPRDWYVLLRGTASVMIRSEDGGPPVELNTLSVGASIGEFAIMYQCPRSATVVAGAGGCVVGALSIEDYDRLLKRHHMEV